MNYEVKVISGKDESLMIAGTYLNVLPMFDGKEAVKETGKFNLSDPDHAINAQRMLNLQFGLWEKWQEVMDGVEIEPEDRLGVVLTKLKNKGAEFGDIPDLMDAVLELMASGELTEFSYSVT